VLHDLDLFKRANKLEVGLTITTGDEEIKQLFEPNVPSVKERIKALEKLHIAGIRTYAMIAPMLPKAEGLVDWLTGKVDYVLIDRMNYHYGDWVYRKYRLEDAMNDKFFIQKGKELASGFEEQGIECRVLF
jgi:DNA repair photolyase